MCYFVGSNVLLCNHLMCGIWCLVLYKRFVFLCCKEFGFCVKSSCYSELEFECSVSVLVQVYNSYIQHIKPRLHQAFKLVQDPD